MTTTRAKLVFHLLFANVQIGQGTTMLAATIGASSPGEAANDAQSLETRCEVGAGER